MGVVILFLFTVSVSDGVSYPRSLLSTFDINGRQTFSVWCYVKERTLFSMTTLVSCGTFGPSCLTSKSVPKNIGHPLDPYDKDTLVGVWVTEGNQTDTGPFLPVTMTIVICYHYWTLGTDVKLCHSVKLFVHETGPETWHIYKIVQ